MSLFTWQLTAGSRSGRGESVEGGGCPAAACGSSTGAAQAALNAGWGPQRCCVAQPAIVPVGWRRLHAVAALTSHAVQLAHALQPCCAQGGCLPLPGSPSGAGCPGSCWRWSDQSHPHGAWQPPGWCPMMLPVVCWACLRHGSALGPHLGCQARGAAAERSEICQRLCL